MKIGASEREICQLGQENHHQYSWSHNELSWVFCVINSAFQTYLRFKMSDHFWKPQFTDPIDNKNICKTVYGMFDSIL